MSPLRKTALRRLEHRRQASELLARFLAGDIDAYLCFRQLHVLYRHNSSGLPELRTLWEIAPPDGTFEVSDAFCEALRQAAPGLLARLRE